MPAYVSARAAAESCGVSERTLRRWIAAGRLPADKDGGSFRIAAADIEKLTGHRNGHAAAPAPAAALSATDRQAAAAPDTDAAADDPDTPRRDETILTLLAEVRRLNDERAELYGRLGYFQAQLEQAQTTIKALEAPKEPEPAPVAPRWPEEPTPAAPLRRSWWRFW